MSKRNQHILATQVNITEAFLSQIKHGERNASSLIADRLALLTGTDIRVWLKGGDVSKRHEAVARWSGCADDASLDVPLTNNIGLTCEKLPGFGVVGAAD